MELHNAVKKYGSINAAARELGIAPSTFRRRLEKERRESIKSFSLPPAITYTVEDKTRHFIVTSAQDKTEVHTEFLNNLIVYSKFLDAEILIGGFTYSKKLFMDNDPTSRNNDVWFAEEVEPYVVHDRIALGDGIVFCGEMNTLPTATQPLAGLETYTKDKWGIFPHAKIQLRSIATKKNVISKQIMTTGSVTLPNYIRKKAGVKAEFHHQIGAVIVSIAPDGAFFCRHVQATSFEDGSFYDLDRYVSHGAVTEEHRPLAIVHGDIHIEKVDPEVAWSTWGYDAERRLCVTKENSLTNQLKPYYRVFHDLIDFSARNHHNIDDHHFRYKTYFRGDDSVKQNIQLASNFLTVIDDPDIQTFVIQSNHDNALIKWLKNPHVRYDPENYQFWLECELHYIKALRVEGHCFLFKEIMQDLGTPPYITFISEDGEDAELSLEGVDLSMHGHRGANGSRGSAIAFTKMGPKSITGHSHTPSITDGHMAVGTNSLLDLGYNLGLSSWAHTNALLYRNGQRALITMMNGRWFD